MWMCVCACMSLCLSSFFHQVAPTPDSSSQVKNKCKEKTFCFVCLCVKSQISSAVQPVGGCRL